jgi:hypothetical protein
VARRCNGERCTENKAETPQEATKEPEREREREREREKTKTATVKLSMKLKLKAIADDFS